MPAHQVAARRPARLVAANLVLDRSCGIGCELDQVADAPQAVDVAPHGEGSDDGHPSPVLDSGQVDSRMAQGAANRVDAVRPHRFDEDQRGLAATVVVMFQGGQRHLTVTAVRLVTFRS